ncbi:winged helix-turn-helix domain-containing protein [Rhodoligotrophos defluvii]|uniref:winged helix-turn-helix domain-containing protein n=1 Tax=Rhodoligotrophos defluvii TaxID=2561934 RepID=UPI0010C9A44F|nr:winged helix-turn-helix domain-containing protein [Rhodoligotrophos defluvii]
MRDSLSLGQARRIALAAQAFGRPRPDRPITRRDLSKTLDALGLFQIDSVNVLVRSHYLPAFSRLGAYDTMLLDDLAYGRRRALFEYWGHEASLIPLSLHPLLRWRMRLAAEGKGIYGGLARFAEERRSYIAEVKAEVAARGPLAAGELASGSRGEGGWWGWSEGKRALEFLFWAGEITTKTRRSFERIYDLTERVIPSDILNLPTPSMDEAHRALLRLAARALGLGTERDLRDYFRLDVEPARQALHELVEEGALVPVTVEGWRQPAFLDAQARLPRRVSAQALLTPFDPLVWERHRTERLFDFRYRLELYTPAHKRIHGYYVLPFLMNDRLTARVDLKADRPAGQLLVQGLHVEPKMDQEEVAAGLGEELGRMRQWLGLGGVEVKARNELASLLRKALETGA